jgi:uncharacterized protein (TIGR02147 family)
MASNRERIDLKIKKYCPDPSSQGEGCDGIFEGPMDELYEAQDYRPWLRRTLRSIRRSRPSRTSKALAEALEIDPAHLSRVLGGRKHLALRHVARVAEFLDLSLDHARYLETLVRFNVETDPWRARRIFQELRAQRGDFGRTLADDAHEYFSSWIHPALRTLLSIVEFRGTGWTRLASLFRKKTTPDEVRASVQLLERLGLVEADPRGILRPGGGTVTTGEKWKGEAIGEFQRQSLDLSRELLDTVAREERDVSTLTLPASRARLDELHSKIRQFRSEVAAWARDLPEEDLVVQLNIQLFPLADARLSDRPRVTGGPST